MTGSPPPGTMPDSALPGSATFTGGATPARRARAYRLAAMSVAIVAFGLLVVRPGYQKLSMARAELEQIQTRMGGQGQELARLDALTGEVNQLRAHRGRMRAAIPEDHDLGDFLRDLGVVFERHGLANAIFQPRPSEPTPASWIPPGARKVAANLQTLPVLVQCEGRYDSIFQSLRDLESMPRLTQIETFKATSDPAKPGHLKVELLLHVFYLPGATAAGQDRTP